MRVGTALVSDRVLGEADTWRSSTPPPRWNSALLVRTSSERLRAMKLERRICWFSQRHPQLNARALASVNLGIQGNEPTDVRTDDIHFPFEIAMPAIPMKLSPAQGRPRPSRPKLKRLQVRWFSEKNESRVYFRSVTKRPTAALV